MAVQEMAQAVPELTAEDEAGLRAMAAAGSAASETFATA
jgi:hypothetical protein